MMRLAFFLWFVTLAAGCIVEDRPVGTPSDGGVDAGPCGVCPVDRPVCTSALQCVECTADDEDYCAAQGLVCNLESSTCVECAGDRDCTDPNAARCDDGTCTACDDRAQCDDVDGLPGNQNACNEEGVCVDCTPESEADTCPGFTACNPRTEECTDVQIGRLEVCEECVSDSQCGEDGDVSEAHRCVPMFYPNPETRFPNSETGFCLKSTDGGCVRPYSVTLDDRASLSDLAGRADYCGVDEEIVTCPAVRGLLNDTECPGGSDEECETSGICRDVGSLQNRCTYLCVIPAQCPAGPPADTCGSSGSGGDDYCGG